MPSRKKCKSRATLEERIERMYSCKRSAGCAVAPLMSACVNCRLGVEAAQSRVYARKMRALRSDASCSSDMCVKFILSVPQGTLRTHLASMAWWRFSLDPDDPNLKTLLDIVRGEPIGDIPFGDDYMHEAVRVLGACTPGQLVAWFGHETPYQMAMFYSGRGGSSTVDHCTGCFLLHRGCTQANTDSAERCTLWSDGVVSEALAGSPIISGGRDEPECRDDDGEGGEDEEA